LIMAVFDLARLWLIFQMLGPGPAVTIGRETTYIEAPLASDGLPDYFEYIRSEARRGVTRSNNAAALFWQIKWSDDVEPLHVRAAAELGTADLADDAPAIEDLDGATLRDETVQWLRETGFDPPEAKPTEEELGYAPSPEYLDVLYRDQCRQWLENVASLAMHRPWRSEDCQPLASWLQRNARALDLAVEASHRTKFYAPLLRDDSYEGPPVVGMVNPGLEMARTISRGLNVRAMWHAGEGRHEAAFDDLMACLRLAQLVNQAPTLVGKLVATAVEGTSLRSLQNLIATSAGDRAFYDRIRRELADREPAADMIRAVVHDERLMVLDAVTDMIRRPEQYSNPDGGASHVSPLRLVRFDWDLVLRRFNHMFDLLETYYRETDPVRREALGEECDNLFEEYDALQHNWQLFYAGYFSPAARSELMFSKMFGLLMPATGAAMQATHRSRAAIQLSHTAAALAEWRAAHGSYPRQLADMVPDLLDGAPVDPFGAPLYYEPNGDGFVLYCVDTDDPARIAVDEIGENAPADDRPIPRGRDDDEADFYSIRVPLEPADWPSR
jgi:hypothetical protein